MIDVEPPQERAILLSAPDKRISRKEAQDHLDELSALTDTAGAEVVATLEQPLQAPHPAYYIGTGKVEELSQLVATQEATLVIFDEDLTPMQGQKLEEALGVRVMDRTELIIDIFALRARSAEARTQVELAQLQYLLPRLKRMWTHLSRIRGGIGLRGPGETQLETDRRMIRRKISELKKRLERVARQRATQRKGRVGEYRVALVGYTNVGKSSILAKMSDSDLFIEDRLFATLDPATRAVDLGEGFRALVTDTVGFIRKLPHDLVASFRATLEEVNEADVLCHVVDVAHPGWEEQYEVVEGVIAELRFNPRRRLVVFNKVDRLTHPEESAIDERASALLGDHVFTSTLESGGLETLRTELKRLAMEDWPTVTLTIPASEGRVLAELYREGEVVWREQRGERIQLRIRLRSEVLDRLKVSDKISIFEAPPAA
ncbi:MAG TPA: GTPase HflX [Gemmatimonadota bacterium]|nr:GTPase HflX [Gemmatimonadota bacterium]